MKTTAAHALTVAAVLTALSGCQSGPGWAWWKSKEAPIDSSAVARSATPATPNGAPALPTAQSTPQTITSSGLQPVTSPSAANLAAAGTPGSTNLSVPVTSPSTIANAPLANYPSTDAIADKLVAGKTNAAVTGAAPSNSLVGNSIPSMPAGGSAAHVPPTTMASNGPYDPNSYKPSAAASPTSASPTGEMPAGADRYSTAGGSRYGISPADTLPIGSEEPPQNATNVPAAAPTNPAPSGDRYGFSTPANTVMPQANAMAAAPFPASSAPSAAPPTGFAPPTATQSRPTSFAALTAEPTTPPTSANIQASATPSQFRPGGTSSFVRPAQAVEVATLPPSAAPRVTLPPSSIPSSMPATAAPSTQPPSTSGGSVPWTPPAASPTGARY